MYSRRCLPSEGILKTIVLSAVALLVLNCSAATIRIDPIPGPVPVGGTVNVSVSASDVDDVYAFQFDLAFNPALLSATAVSEGQYLRQRGNTFFIPGNIDNSAGTITVTADTLLGPPFINIMAPLGPLVTFGFTGLSPGTSAVTLSNVILLDSAGSDIAVTVQNGSVMVALPEPPSAILFGTALVVVLLIRRYHLGRSGCCT